MTASPELSYPAAGGRGITTGRNPYFGMARRRRPPVAPIGATPPGPPPEDVPMSLRPLAGNAVSAGLIVAAEAQLGGTDNAPTRLACPTPTDPAAPSPAGPADTSAADPGPDMSPRPESAAAPVAALSAFIKKLKPATVPRRNCGLNGPPARDPLVTAVLKKLPFKKVPSAELSDPLSRPASHDDSDPEEEPEAPDAADDNVDCTVPAGVSAA